MNKRPRSISAPFKFDDARRRVQDALLLSAAVMFGAFPMFVYQYRHLTAGVFAAAPTDRQVYAIAMGQCIILFCAALLCSLVGFLYSERLSIPGFGRARDAWRWMLRGIVAGLFITPVSYFLIDRELIQHIPEMFPEPWYWALSWMAGSALSQEAVARFGLLTIGVYILDWLNFKRHTRVVVALVSLFGVAGTYLFLSRLYLLGRPGPDVVALSLVLVFVVQWILCEVYLRKGFVASLCLHFGLMARLLVYQLIL